MKGQRLLSGQNYTIAELLEMTESFKNDYDTLLEMDDVDVNDPDADFETRGKVYDRMTENINIFIHHITIPPFSCMNCNELKTLSHFTHEYSVLGYTHSCDECQLDYASEHIIKMIVKDQIVTGSMAYFHDYFMEEINYSKYQPFSEEWYACFDRPIYGTCSLCERELPVTDFLYDNKVIFTKCTQCYIKDKETSLKTLRRYYGHFSDVNGFLLDESIRDNEPFMTKSIRDKFIAHKRVTRTRNIILKYKTDYDECNANEHYYGFENEYINIH